MILDEVPPPGILKWIEAVYSLVSVAQGDSYPALQEWPRLSQTGVRPTVVGCLDGLSIPSISAGSPKRIAFRCGSCRTHQREGIIVPRGVQPPRQEGCAAGCRSRRNQSHEPLSPVPISRLNLMVETAATTPYCPELDPFIIRSNLSVQRATTGLSSPPYCYSVLQTLQKGIYCPVLRLPRQ